jgi:hypothetical protein
MASRRKRRTSKDQRARGQFDRLRHTEGEDGKQEENMQRSEDNSTDYGMQRERMASKRRTCRDQRTIRQTTACRGKGWQARGEHAEIRGQFDILWCADEEDGKQEEEENKQRSEDN